jgi:nitrogen fixation NifU-like protein
MQLDALYQEIILDHYRKPHHRGLREPYDVEVHHVNPTCGDEVTVRVRVVDGAVTDVSYDGLGCSISQASTSVMTDPRDRPYGAGRDGDERGVPRADAEQGAGEPDEEVLEDAVAFAGVSKYPARIKCALLGWMAWKDATAQALQRHDEQQQDKETA